MTKPNRSRYRLATLRQNAAEKLGGGTIDFETPDGAEFSIPAPGFWPDSAKEAIRAGDDLALAAALLGENHAKFVEAGGRSDDLTLLFGAYAEGQGSTVGE
ncbi:hypothetical protein OG401_23835 [Kitasatospora purpeofusca]|uniref:hypothetical protein n=1 Tax=Kitasatospora purpeofusca TaxID=67352 RepID=UPI00224FB237|nr:hypothetical protein [Kitasatospora purpeofusca]MCX4687295.1 hypothetical protein [Kitasatospora purpeofusca]